MPSINPRASHPDVTDLPEDATLVSVEKGLEYGYVGASPDTRDRKDYTIAGVTSSGRNPGPTESVPESPRRSSRQSKSNGSTGTTGSTAGATSK